ncbi:hypothetical protein F4677DRAFT_11303 [Hypoxylon crocopeplum]|nr:hypothetical protein F4677DRAFT_11303 [Hypoxylon crocopeplum]
MKKQPPRPQWPNPALQISIHTKQHWSSSPARRKQTTMFRPMSPERHSPVPKAKPRTPYDVIFGELVYQHTTNTRYAWKYLETAIFQDYIRQNPDTYLKDIDSLLVKLNLDGYDHIAIQEGKDFKGCILMPKVMRKLTEVASNNADFFKRDSDQ